MKKALLAISVLALTACSPAPEKVYVDSTTGEPVPPPASTRPKPVDKTQYYEKVCLGGVLYYSAPAGHYAALTPVYVETAELSMTDDGQQAIKIRGVRC